VGDRPADGVDVVGGAGGDEDAGRVRVVGPVAVGGVRLDDGEDAGECVVEGFGVGASFA
jgi:hypothetical protein